MIIELIITILTFSLAYWKEARHDYNLWLNEILMAKELDDGDKNIVAKRRSIWHRIDWQYIAIIGLGWSFIVSPLSLNQIPIIVIISMLKILVFNPRINRLKEIDWNHLSNEGFESRFRNNPNLYYLIAFILALGASAYLIIKPF